jgi:hypothetical protein
MKARAVQLSTCLLVVCGPVAYGECPPALDLSRQHFDAFAAKRELVVRHVPEALFSAMSYQDEGTASYLLPQGWSRGASYRDDASGLFMATFVNRSEARLDIAIRGTELSTLTDIQNNLFDNRQLAPALRFTREIMAAHPGMLVTVTGHSLGGALALELSHRLNGLDSVAFNPSPRFGNHRNPIPYYRVIFRERDEPLEAVRGSPEDIADWGLRYNVLLDIVPGIWGYRLLTQHAIAPMALGMLVIAAIDSAAAAELLERTCRQLQD